MKETLYNRVKVVPCLNTAAITTATTTNGTAVDLDQVGQDFRSATAVVVTGTLTDGSYTVAVQESPNGTTGWVNVPADRVIGTAIPTITATDDNKIYELGIIPDPGTAPFLRIAVTSTTVTTGGTLSAFFLLGQSNRNPVNRP